MRKKLLISLLLFVIASVVGTTSTCAFFLFNNSSDFNVKLASVDILVMQTGSTGSIVDATGDTTYEKGIKVKNLSTIPVFVRVSISEEWEKEQENLPSNNLSYNYGSVINEPDTYIGTKEWYKSNDNYYYRRLELEPMQESGDIITDFTIKNASSIYSGSTLNLNIAAETCQTKNALWKKVFDVTDNPLPTPVENSWDNQVTETIYADTSGASAPELSSNMIPVKWDGSNWIKADSDNILGPYSWYDYNNKIWANAVTVRSNILDTYKNAGLGTIINMNDILSFFVWVPRYKYAISTGTGPRKINIIFEDKGTTKSTGTAIGTEYRTHPGFTFGSNELNGIWVGKFETTGVTGSVKIKPNMPSLRNQTISEQFYEARNMQATYNIHSFPQTGINTHMMKSVENGALSYLTQSEYGKNDEVWINPANNYYTGCAGNSPSSSSTIGCSNTYDTINGMQASTTGNIYGVYDLSGGANENLMAVYNKTISSSNFDSSFFSDTLNDKYYDLYTSTNVDTACNGICYGQALSETSGWYSDYTSFVDSTNSWNRTSGTYSDTTNSGIFAYNSYTGAASTDTTFRVVATNVNITDNQGPTVVFGMNGNSTYAKSRNTTVTVSDSDSGVNTSSLKYQWTTSNIIPSEDSFNTMFASGQSIDSPSGVTGAYYLWILAKDTTGNTTITISNVFNLDNTIPVITMLGSNPITINVGDIYTDAGATASDNIDGNITSNIQVTSTVNAALTGIYTVIYTVSDSSGNAAIPVVRMINVGGVPDTTAPTVAFGINGNSTYAKNRNTTVTVSDSDLGVNTSSLKYQWTTSTTAPTEGSFTTEFTNESTITSPTGVTGTYYLWILAKDNIGNTAITSSNVFNLDNTVPVITMNGSSPITINVGGTYTDAGATANDNIDGNITGSIQTTSTVNPSIVGTYTVTYNVSDSSGNAATPVVRTINVVPQSEYVDSEGINKPRLVTGMTAVKWNSSTSAWDTVSNPDTDTSWYDYTNKEWANAVTQDGSMWVWIPRYIYKISSGWHSSTTGTINIQFTKDANDNWNSATIGTINTDTSANASNNTWTNEPAFTFGNTQLTGIWVAKFEASANEGVTNGYTANGSCVVGDNVTTKTVKIIPNATSWRCISIGNTFTVSQNMKTNSVYGWGTSGSGIDTHLMKNTEWGAVAYLSKSIYGQNTNEVWINPANPYTTGCAGDSVSSTATTGCLRTYETTNGVKASTTGTIYGIYDMSGGTWEYEAAYVSNGNLSAGASITSASNWYKDIYIAGGTDDQAANYGLTINQKGDALYETSNNINGQYSWFGDYSYMPYTTTPWIRRGGNLNSNSGAGLFYFNNYWGGADSLVGFRPTLAVISSSLPDTTAPLITMNGSSPVTINVGDTYTDAGATASDNIDGNITARINTVSTVNPSIPGTYTVTYNVSDTAGNAATSLIRTVYVVSSEYIASEGVNKPKLTTGMTAIKWNNGTSTWDTVSNPDTDTSWYDYTNKEWANAKTADGSMWVWIPRYIYRISSGWHSNTTGTIDVQFSYGTDDTRSGTVTLNTSTGASASNNTWTDEPAFTFGSDELTGIWVAKFEATASEGVSNGYTSDGSCPIAGDNVITKTIKIIPNAHSWRCISIGNMFTLIRNMQTKNVYGWGTSGNGIDTHLMKRTEWGATAYLSKSIYGKNTEVWINPANDYTTGCAGTSVSSGQTTGCINAYNTTNGLQASTTGNIYGIYDMSGGSWEYVSAYVNNGNGNLNEGTSILNADPKYKDVYTVGTTDDQSNNYGLTINKKGNAMYETSSSGSDNYSWYGDYSSMPYTDTPWFMSSGSFTIGSGAGLFYFSHYWGGEDSYGSFRPTLAVISSSLPDTTPPVITMNGSSPVTINVGDTYTDVGATASDNVDGDITGRIQVTGTVNPSISGTYTVTYNVSDTAGNVATPVVRTVNVITPDYSGPKYIVSKGVNGPVLATGMVPIKWNGSTWVDTTTTDSSWYDYTSKNWANARTQDGSMWVWIPRYIYKISSGWHSATTGTMNIQFTKELDDNWNSTTIGTINTDTSANASNNTWTNQSAFTFGSKQLTGIWVAKFEASVSNQSDACYTNPSSTNCNKTTLTPKIAPNVQSWNFIQVANMFTVARNMETSSTYGWGTASGLNADGSFATDTNGINTHLMKNVEWGVVVYLSKSIYGQDTSEVWVNNSITYITGCAGNSVTATGYSGCQNAYNTTNGFKASTTGTIYGIYDMSGGVQEITAAYSDGSSTALSTNGNSLYIADDRYKDKYVVTTDTASTNYSNAISKKGDAIYETSSSSSGTNAWFSDTSGMVNVTYPWFIRGGRSSASTTVGIFTFDSIVGTAVSNTGFRPVLVND